MGKPSAVDPSKPQETTPRARWPFDPLQPGGHEPARREELERVQKQAGAGRDTQPKDKR